MSSPRILIADDDLSMRLLATEALEGAGFEVVETDSGEAALERFASVRPDAVLLDVMMGGIDGFETCARIRELPRGRTTPVLMMTGLEDTSAIDQAYEAGATDFITKPINYRLLSHRVRYLLRAAAAFRSVHESARRFSQAQRLARLVQWELDIESGCFRWSDEANEIFGLRVEAGARSVEDLLRWVHAEDRARVREAVASHSAHRIEYRLLLPDGGERIIHQEAEVVCEELGARRLIGAAQDVTERRSAERRATQLAYFDSLTGLPNRAFLRRYLRVVAADAQRYQHAMAVMVLDLDLFKRVNDMLGHAAGDALLTEVAERLRGCIRSSDELARDVDHLVTADIALHAETLAARLGGDEFIIVLPRMRSPEDAAIVARRILEELSTSFKVEGTELFISVSIGIATYPENGPDVDTLLKNADTAMYHAKESGRNNFQFFNQAIHQKARRRLELEHKLRTAVAQIGTACEFELHFQPKVAIPSGKVVGMEALLRWTPPALGSISPAEFIPIAEDSGLIVPLGEWVLRTACLEGRVTASKALRVAVNISARQFHEPGFARMVRRILEETGFPAQMLEIELTEGVVMKDTEHTHEVLSELKALGVRVALDDFGTGYSSLSYLTRFPIDILKIDRSFLKDLGAKRNNTIISAIIALSKSLAMDVVAEGVETADQLAFLQQHGAMEIQGFYFSRPLAPSQARDWISARSRDR